MSKEKFIGYGEGPNFIPHWGFIAPHTYQAQGAMSYAGDYSEYYYAGIMLDILDLPWATRNIEGVTGAAKYLSKKHGTSATIEPHFNAFNTQVSGAEILVLDGDHLSLYYAELIIDTFKVFFPNRKVRGTGIKRLKKGSRGFKNLDRAKKAGMDVALLTELFFGDNEADWMTPRDQATFWKECLNVYQDL